MLFINKIYFFANGIDNGFAVGWLTERCLTCDHSLTDYIGLLMEH